MNDKKRNMPVNTQNNFDISALYRLTLLYVEDDDIQRENIAKTLQLYFKKVLIAKDGFEALKLLEEHRVQIFLLDYVMPNMSGYELAKTIRKTDHKTPIIIASAYSDKEKLLSAIEAGVIHYIEKPITQEKLLCAFEKAVNELLESDLIEVVFPEQNSRYDLCEQVFYKDDKKVKLSKNETQIFELLLKNKTSLVQKETIENEVFENQISDNALRNVIYRLRKKVGSELIETVPDLGFRIL